MLAFERVVCLPKPRSEPSLHALAFALRTDRPAFLHLPNSPNRGKKGEQKNEDILKKIARNSKQLEKEGQSESLQDK